jgi:hypothetical protein
MTARKLDDRFFEQPKQLAVVGQDETAYYINAVEESDFVASDGLFIDELNLVFLLCKKYLTCTED